VRYRLNPMMATWDPRQMAWSYRINTRDGLCVKPSQVCLVLAGTCFTPEGALPAWTVRLAHGWLERGRELASVWLNGMHQM
jgi:hypothetical protein